MRIRNMILAICLVALVPGMAAAKRPQAAPETGCAILVDDIVYIGHPYAVKVVRVPSYPGAWRNPMVTVEANYTGSGTTGSATIDPSLANVFSVTYVNANLVVPSDADFGGTATITATIKEPLKKKDTYKTTTCSVTSNIQ